MQFTAKSIGALLIFSCVVVGIAFLIPQDTKENTEKDEVGRTPLQSSLFAIGSDNAPKKVYESITREGEEQTKTDEERGETQHTTLTEFLRSYATIEQETDTSSGSVNATAEITQALKTYGNEVGTIIAENTRGLPDESEALEDFLTEPSNTAYQNVLQERAEAYTAISEDLKGLEVPPTVAQFTQNFADAHAIIGGAIRDLLVADVPIEYAVTYNDNLSPYIESYLSIAQLLRAYGVEFKDSEPGSIFTLPF